MLLAATSDDPDRRDASDPEGSDPDTSAPEASAEQPEPGELGPSVLPAEAAASPPPEVPGPTPVPSGPELKGDAGEPDPITPEVMPPSSESLTGAPFADAPDSPLDDAEVLPDSPPAPMPESDAAQLDGHASPVVEPEPALAGTSTRPPAEISQPDKTDETKRSPLQSAMLAVLIIAAAALIGYVLSRPSGREANADALVRSIEAAGRLQLRLETDIPAEARNYIREEFGWRVGVPVFEAIPLRGVAIGQTAPAVEVPVFLYADSEDRNVAVFAYSYALLDQVPDRLQLTSTDYDELDKGMPFVRRADGNDVVIWRDRDDIYIAVTDLPPDALTERFAMAR